MNIISSIINIKKLKRKLTKLLFREQWSILILDKKIKKIYILRKSENIHWADPFPVYENNKYYIFLEQQIIGKNGTIGYIEINNKDEKEKIKYNKILEKEYHLSYPFIFSIDTGLSKKWYLIPESHENKSIDLYYATSFPNKWVYVMTLMNGVEAVDTTLLFHFNKWWLFTSLKKDGYDKNDALFVFFSETFPSNNWKPHKRNPIVTGIERSRMAGRIFFDKEKGKLIRPAQNCKKEYGRMINLFSIDVLTEEDYSENLIETIYPEKKYNIVCTHTYNTINDLIVRDIKIRRFRIFKQLNNRDSILVQ